MLAFYQISFISLIILSVLYLASFYLIAKKDDFEKLSSYESGFEPLGNARMKISILYWIIGILYLIFDFAAAFVLGFVATFDFVFVAAFVCFCFAGMILILLQFAFVFAAACFCFCCSLLLFFCSRLLLG